MDDFNGLDWLIFKEQMSYNKISKHFRKYCTDNPEILDKLFDEVIDAKKILENLKNTAFNQKSIEHKWHYIFKNVNFPNLKNFVSIFLSIYTSNAFVEGIFSKMNSLWTDEKNKFHVETVNSIIFVKENSELTCEVSYEYFISNTDILNKAKCAEKYGREK